MSGDAEPKRTHSELSKFKRARVVSAQISKALVIFAGLSAPISSNSFNNLLCVAAEEGEKWCSHRHRCSWPDRVTESCLVFRRVVNLVENTRLQNQAFLSYL